MPDPAAAGGRGAKAWLRGFPRNPVLDAVLTIFTGILAFVLAAMFDLEERWHVLADAYEPYVELDELPIAFTAFGIGFAWFAWRRWKDYAHAAREWQKVNDALSLQLAQNQRIITDLHEARERALELDRAKTRFLAHMSHELRTPLNAIIGFSDLMQMQGYERVDPENFDAYTASIRDSGHHLLELINDLLDLSRIESGDLVPCEGVVVLGDILDAAMRMFAERAGSAGIRLTTVQTPAARIQANLDARMIRQVLINLISNALRHTPEGGSVELTPYRNDDGSFGFTVVDTGEGMDAGAATRAQAGFAEVENAMRREHHGAGIGLPLSRSIMQAHGGNLTLTSQPGEGTRIDLWLPAYRAVDTPAALMSNIG